MFEIKLCATCGRYKCAEHNADVRTENFNKVIMNQRACADCIEYTLVTEMIEKADGRYVCHACEQKTRAKAIDKAQPNLFVQQSDLF